MNTLDLLYKGMYMFQILYLNPHMCIKYGCEFQNLPILL